MSTIVRCPDGKIKVFTKGADTVILERLSEHQPYTEKTLIHLEVSCLFSIPTQTFSQLCRTMPQKASVRSASLSARSLSKSTDNG